MTGSIQYRAAQVETNKSNCHTVVLFPAALCTIVNLPEHRNVIPSWGKLGGTGGQPEPLRTGIGSDLEQQQSDLGASACEVMDLRGRRVYGSEGTSEGRGQPSIG
jgi:hypothetical protein